MAIVAGIMAMASQQPAVVTAGDPAGFVPPPPAASDAGAWTGMPEAGATPMAEPAVPESSDPTPTTGDTMSEVESAMPEADVSGSNEPDTGSGTGVPAPEEDPPGTS